MEEVSAPISPSSEGANVAQPPLSVSQAGIHICLEKLEGAKNYALWKFQMKLMLIDFGLWDCIESPGNDIARDQRAYAKICLHIHSACYPHVKKANTAKEAWDNLKSAYENSGISRRLSLKRELARIDYNNFSSMERYISRIMEIAQELSEIGCEIDDNEVAEIMLIGLPDEYTPLIMAIEGSQYKLTSENVKLRLMQGEHRRNESGGQKLLAEECLAANNEIEGAFHFSESVSAMLRILTVYRDEQLMDSANEMRKITNFIKPVMDIGDNNSISQEEQQILNKISFDTESITATLKLFEIDEDVPFHKRYLRFSAENNVDNFQKILKELPKEWTIIQLTAPYNPNENLKPLEEFKTEIDSLYLSIFTNDYLETAGLGPVTVNVPANVTKEGEKPLFVELYSSLTENYDVINSALYINKKCLARNYWAKREDVDLRMKSLINTMDKEWLGGWGCLLTGKLVDTNLRDKIIKLVDDTISDWGFIKLSPKQKFFLYNLIETSPMLTLHQIIACIRRILTEHGNPEEIRRVLNGCQCNREFTFLNELCPKCLSKSFELLHHFSLVDGIRAFSRAATQVRENDEWACLKKARRHPVILIVDEILDIFPWESLSILNSQPVSRIENIHFLYYLYKIHEKDVIDGYFSTSADNGRYVINPDNNLQRMEKRMSSFIEYWCNNWTGHIGQPPPPNEFVQYLTEADIFLYCGHGNGCHFAMGGANGAGVEGATGTRCVTVLSGCGSVRLTSPAGRTPPSAAHHHLHIAGSPMVVGMLWEVTDLEVDKVISTLMSLYVPSKAPLPWLSVGKAQWCEGVLDTNLEAKTQIVPEPDLLKAVCRARTSTSFTMIATSMVARGIPVRIRTG